MDFLSFLISKTENDGGKVIGKFECSIHNLTSSFLTFAGQMGMSSPVRISKQSSRLIKITKKGDKYIIKLNMYNPPIEIVWTNMQPIENLKAILDSIAETNKKIGYVNTKQLDNGKQLFQLALA